MKDRRASRRPPHTHKEDGKGLQASNRDTVNTNVISGLVLHLAADCDDMESARRAERILHTIGYARIIAEQDAHEQ